MYMCVCTVCVNVCTVSCVYFLFPVCVLWTVWYFSCCVYLIHQLWVKGRERTGTDRKGNVPEFSDFSSERCNISRKMTQIERRNARTRVLLSVSWQNIKIHRYVTETCRRNHHSLGDTRNGSLKNMRVDCVCVTFTGDVVFAGCGEASAAVAVDGCYSELVPALRSQIWQNHIFRKGLKKNTNKHITHNDD